jgi:serine/threonine protein kinase
MSALHDSRSVPSDESGFACSLLPTLATDSAARSVQQPQREHSGHEAVADHSQLFNAAVHREEPDTQSEAFVDDTPTDQLLPGPQQLATAGEMRVELAPGSVLRSRYVLEEVIGRGGTSIIYRAEDLHRALPQNTAAHFIAIKVLRTEQRGDPLALSRLRREFQQMKCLSHPGIVQVLDLDCDGDVWFMSMELVAGRTVKTWIETPGDHSNALRIIDGSCEALEHAHSLGILHGDLKPSNVMVTEDGTAKLIDFGSAASPGILVAAGSDPPLAFTPLYASPQILAGKSAERRDDVYSLACLSYNILSGGRHPFGGHPSLEDGRAKSAPTYVRAIPAGLFEVLKRGLSAERDRRPASVREFLRDLTDADRRSRAAATSAATPALGNVGAVRHPGSMIYAANGAGISTAALMTSADKFGGSQSAFWHVQPFVRPIVLLVAIAGTAVLYLLGVHRDVIRAPEVPPEVSATSPELEVTARSDVFPETRPLLHNSGVISLEASAVHANAMQSLVAISVKRLPATRSRGVFVWRVRHGTAHPGVDYQGIKPQVVSFIEGQAVRTLFVPLINTPATMAMRSPRTFTVALEQVAGGPALGRFARVTVVIDPPPTSNAFVIYQARAAK